MRNSLISLLIAGSITLAGCGGGGGGNTRPDPMPEPPVREPAPDPDPMPEPEPEPQPEPVVPPAPSGVEVSAGIGVAIVSWDTPFRHYEEHARALVYRSTRNDFGSATLVGSSESFLYTDKNLRSDTTYYYWVVWESTDGLRGPVSASVHDTTGLNPGDVPVVQPPAEDEEEEESEPEPVPKALEGPATLQSVGTARQTGTATYTEVNVGGRFPGTFMGTRPAHSFNNWGLWATVGGETLFRVDIRPDRFGLSPALHIEGGQSLSNPVSGSAVWTGGVRAYDAHPDTYGTPVTGTARLEVDFSAATMDVDFTGFSGGHPDLSWDGLRISNGRFGDQRGGYREIIGAFYGAEHQGVAGRFQSPRLDGVFGATR